jgi:hypothetical protein
MNPEQHRAGLTLTFDEHPLDNTIEVDTEVVSCTSRASTVELSMAVAEGTGEVEPGCSVAPLPSRALGAAVVPSLCIGCQVGQPGGQRITLALRSPMTRNFALRHSV